MRVAVTAFIFILPAFFLAGCGGKEDRKLQHLERGLEFLADQNYDKARIEFKNLGQIDPKEAQAYLHLGEIEEHEHAFEKAFSYYNTAINLDSELIKPRLKIIQIYIAQAAAARSRSDKTGEANALALAQKQITETLKRKPDQAEGLMLQASFWLQEGKLEEALRQLEKLVAKDAGHESAVVLLTRLYVQENRNTDAESLLINAIKHVKNNAQLREMLARFYENNGESGKAEEVLFALVDDFQETPDYRLTLSAFLVRSGRANEAEHILRAAMGLNLDDTGLYSHYIDLVLRHRGIGAAIKELESVVEQNPGIHELQFKLVDFYRNNDQNLKARQFLTNLIKRYNTKPTGLQARVILAAILAEENEQSDYASLLIEEVLRGNPRDHNALLLRGKIAVNNNDWTAAINDYRLILADQPDSVEILSLLSEAFTGNGDLELATEALTKVIKLVPEDNAFRLTLARLLAKGNGNGRKSLEQIASVLERTPDHLEALQLKYELLIIEGNVQGMLDTAKVLQAVAPELEDGFIKEARLLVAQKRYKEAAQLTNKVLARDPDSIDGLLTKTDILIGERNFDEALTVNQQLKQLRPESGIGYLRDARLFRSKRNIEKAIQAYKIALEKAPSLMVALTELIGLELASGKTDEAKNKLIALLQDNSEHPVANYLLGTVLYSTKEYDAADKALRKHLALDSKDESAYSRLAGIRVAKHDLQGAASVYERGIEVLPTSNRLTVELAGIRESEGDFDAARDLYEKVLGREPNNIISMNNLAALILEHWVKDNASLERVASYAEPLSTVEHPAYLDTAGWIYYHLGENDKALKLLSNAVEMMPDIAVFQYHLGMLYYKMGNITAAKNHLDKASLEESDFAGLEEALDVLVK